MSYYVSCQHYYYSGLFAVEIAHGGLDYSGSDMLAMSNKEIKRLEGSYTNPIEAAEAAIKIQEIWQLSKSDVIWLCYGSNLDMIEGATCINDDGYADGGEAYTNEEMLEINRNETKEWAQKQFESLEKCVVCGEIINQNEYYTLPEFDIDNEKYCREYCVEKAYAGFMEDLEEVEA